MSSREYSRTEEYDELIKELLNHEIMNSKSDYVEQKQFDYLLKFEEAFAYLRQKGAKLQLLVSQSNKLFLTPEADVKEMERLGNILSSYVSEIYNATSYIDDKRFEQFCDKYKLLSKLQDHIIYIQSPLNIILGYMASKNGQTLDLE